MNVITVLTTLILYVTLHRANVIFAFTFKNVIPSGYIQCISICLEYSVCVMIFYSKSNLECRLCYRNIAVNALPDEYQNFVKITRDEIKRILPANTACWNHTCSSTKRCATLKSNTIACVPFITDDNRSLRNVAVGQTSTQSSTFEHGTSNIAVDGEWKWNFGRRECTHTLPGFNNWWMVALKKPYSIKSIQILNRGDCCGERLNNFGIYIGLNEGVMDLVHFYSGAAAAKEEITFNFLLPIMGQYVKIQKHVGNTALSLCEVAVFAYE